MKVKWEWTVPNVLSIGRIALVPVFAVLYLMSAQHEDLLVWAIAALVLSGLTDMFDGMIARAFNQTSEIGKLLDPFADKLTQVTVVLCLAVRLPQLWPLLGLCLIKELMQIIGAALLLFRKSGKVQGARWYGKAYTVMFYITMALYVVFPPEKADAKPLFFDYRMPVWLFVVLGTIVGGLMLYSFIQYARVFWHVAHEDTPDEVSAKGETDV